MLGPSEIGDMKGQVVKSIAWLGGLRYLGQIISWAITVIVIRLLSPNDYGLMAMASVWMGFLVMLSELGLGAAIIQKQEIQEEQLPHILGFVILSHVGFGIFLFAGATPVSSYYAEPRLVPILRTISLNFLLLGLYVIPQAVLIRKMDFRKKAVIELVATVAASIATLVMVLSGLGVWALVLNSILFNAASAIGYGFLRKSFYLPRWRFSQITDLLRYGMGIVGTRMLYYFLNKSDILIAGRILGATLIGTYSVALDLVSVPLDKFLPLLTQVAFPAYSRIQSDLVAVKYYFLKTIRLSSTILFPTFWGLAVVAPELITWLLGANWIHTILPLQVLCIVMPLRALAALFSPMLIGIGETSVPLKYTAAGCVIMPAAFYVGSQYGVLGLSLAWVLGFTVVFAVTAKMSLARVNLPLKDFLSNISSGIIGSIVLVATTLVAKYAFLTSVPFPLNTIGLIVLGGISYLTFILVSNKDLFLETCDLLTGLRKAQ